MNKKEYAGREGEGEYDKCEKHNSLRKIFNDPSKSHLDYRIASFSSFKKIMLESVQEKEALKGWTIDFDRPDYGITLIGMWAYLCDILTYYQEQFANEAFIETAKLQESIIELLYLANYIPAMGRSSSAMVRMTAKEDVKSATIPRGFRMQAVSSKNDKPVIFETDEAITVSSDHNLMRFYGWRSGAKLEKGSTSLQLAKAYPELNMGDFILITDHHRRYRVVEVVSSSSTSTAEETTTITAATTTTTTTTTATESGAEGQQQTKVDWSKEEALPEEYDLENTYIYKFMQVVRPFGYNAPVPTVSSLRGILRRKVLHRGGNEDRPEPLPNTEMELIDISGNIMAKTVTNDKGEFFFGTILPSSYNIRIQRLPQLDNIWFLEDIGKKTSAGFQIPQGFDLIMDFVIEGYDYLPGKSPDIMTTLIVEPRGKTPNDPVAGHTLSSTIFLDKFYGNLEVGSFVFLQPEKQQQQQQQQRELEEEQGLQHSSTVVSDASSRLFRISDLRHLRHQAFGIESTSTMISLASPEGDALLSEYVCNWDEVLGYDRDLLLSFLQEKYESKWLSDVIDIVKEEGGRVIKISDAQDNNIFRIKLNDQNTEASLYRQEKNSVEEKLVDFGVRKEGVEQEGGEGEGAFRGKLVLYLDPIKALSFEIKNTHIFCNPTLKLEPSHRSISHDIIPKNTRQIKLEGMLPGLKAGTYLAITDNTSRLHGKVTTTATAAAITKTRTTTTPTTTNDRRQIPLESCILRIFKNIDDIEDQSSSSTSPFDISAFMIRSTVTDASGTFDFDGLEGGTYSLSVYLTPSRFWYDFVSQVVKLEEDQEISKSVAGACEKMASAEYNRTISTALAIFLDLVSELNVLAIRTLNQASELHNSRAIFATEKMSELLQGLKSFLDSDRIRSVLTRSFLRGGREEKKSLANAKNMDNLLIGIVAELALRVESLIISSNSYLQVIPHTETGGTTINGDESSLLLIELQKKLIAACNVLKKATEISLDALKSRTDSYRRIDCFLGTREVTIRSKEVLNMPIVCGVADFLPSEVKSALSKVDTVRISHTSVRHNYTVVSLAQPLNYSYVKGYVELYGNIVQSSHGETVRNEILGSGKASLQHQEFKLRKGPLSYTSSLLSPDEIKSTLKIFVDGVQWQETEDFLNSGPADRHYVVSIDDDGITLVRFGDGRRGATLPTGIDNIVAQYRVGIGTRGNVKAVESQLMTMMDKNPALISTSLAVDSAGGFEEQPSEQKLYAFSNIRTLKRAVSLQDYADLAISFGDIAKSKAFSVLGSNDDNNDYGYKRGQEAVRLVVATMGGNVMDATSRANLRRFLDSQRDTSVPLEIKSFVPVPVDIIIRVQVEENHQRSKVVEEIEKSLGPGKNQQSASYNLFAFEKLDFGKAVSLSDLYNVVEKIPGVVYAVVDKFCRRDAVVSIQEIIRARQDEILQCENDPFDSSKGTIQVDATGGIET